MIQRAYVPTRGCQPEAAGADRQLPVRRDLRAGRPAPWARCSAAAIPRGRRPSAPWGCPCWARRAAAPAPPDARTLRHPCEAAAVRGRMPVRRCAESLMVDLSSDMNALVERLGPPPAVGARVLQFLAARSGDGASTVAREVLPRRRRSVTPPACGWSSSTCWPACSSTRWPRGPRCTANWATPPRPAPAARPSTAWSPRWWGADGRTWADSAYLDAYPVGDARFWLTRFRREALKPRQTLELTSGVDLLGRPAPARGLGWWSTPPAADRSPGWADDGASHGRHPAGGLCGGRRSARAGPVARGPGRRRRALPGGGAQSQRPAARRASSAPCPREGGGGRFVRVDGPWALPYIRALPVCAALRPAIRHVRTRSPLRMANTPGSKKAIRKIEKRTEVNRARRSRVRHLFAALRGVGEGRRRRGRPRRLRRGAVGADARRVQGRGPQEHRRRARLSRLAARLKGMATA